MKSEPEPDAIWCKASRADSVELHLTTRSIGSVTVLASLRRLTQNFALMKDRPPRTEAEAEARKSLVAALRSMLSGELPFIEGAVQVLRLKGQVGGVADHDEDFNAFVVIESETDHLPLQAQRHLWSPEAIARLEAELKHTQRWAESFAPDACLRLIARFSHGQGDSEQVLR